MDMTIRAMTPVERNYCYSQSQQISMQTGLIGHLRADMDSNGKGFFSTFFDFRADLKTEDFKTEFDEVINALRFDENYGGALKDRSALAAYCRRTPESSFGGDGREFGFRADTEQYSYMLRLNPNRGEYNLYCYCYQRKWLDRHLQQAERASALSIRTIRNCSVSRTAIKSESPIRTVKRLTVPAGILTIIMWKSEVVGTVCFTSASLPR